MMNPLLNTLPNDLDDAHRGLAFYLKRSIIEFSNERFCEMMGMTRTEIHGLDVIKHIHPDDLAATQAEIDRFWNQEINTYT